MIRVLCCAAVLYLAMCSLALAHSNFIRSKVETNISTGLISFCKRYPASCAPSPEIARERWSLTEDRWQQLHRVNQLVNKHIFPTIDMEKHGVEDFWEILDCRRDCRGDCEEYVFLKRELLMQRGWPASALLLAVVLDEYGEGHLVLIARTDLGDFVLDNKVWEIVLWHERPYTYMYVQSYVNPEVLLTVVNSP